MIQALHHIAIIASTEASIDFYKRLGFKEVSRTDRGYDILVFLSGYGVTLEIFIDSTHPPRVDLPEALGLRHLALKVDCVEKTLKKLKFDELGIEAEPVREINGEKFAFFKDLDGLPIELHE